MAMDLEFHGRKDFAEEFIQQYSQLSKDKDIPKLLDFYKCYRAYIRAKINCFTQEDQNLNGDKRTEIQKQARDYFRLAASYASLL